MPGSFTEADVKLHLQTLRDSPQRFMAYSAELDDRQLQAAPSPGAWSMRDNMAHVRSGAEVWSYAIYTMLAIEHPVLPDIHPNVWMRALRYTSLNCGENLQAFTLGRDNLLRILNDLPFQEWSRSATVHGKTTEYTVFSQTRRMALHETEHWSQMASLHTELLAQLNSNAEGAQ
jgi:hypothetical protein